MSLSFVHKGRTLNLQLDTRTLTGDANADSSSAYIQGLVAGRWVTVTQYGVALADGNTPGRPMGPLVNDAAGYFYENKPALASGLVSAARGTENVVIVDQIDTSLTFNPGDQLYVGTAAKAGLLTNVAPTGTGANAIVVGVALSAASAAAPSLSVALV